MDIRSTDTLQLPVSDIPVRLPAPRQPIFDVSMTAATETDDVPLSKQRVKEQVPHEYDPGLFHALLADTQEAFTGIPGDFTSGESLKHAFTKHNRLRGVGVMCVLISFVIIIVYVIKQS